MQILKRERKKTLKMKKKKEQAWPINGTLSWKPKIELLRHRKLVPRQKPSLAFLLFSWLISDKPGWCPSWPRREAGTHPSQQSAFSELPSTCPFENHRKRGPRVSESIWPHPSQQDPGVRSGLSAGSGVLSGRKARRDTYLTALSALRLGYLLQRAGADRPLVEGRVP